MNKNHCLVGCSFEKEGGQSIFWWYKLDVSYLKRGYFQSKYDLQAVNDQLEDSYNLRRQPEIISFKRLNIKNHSVYIKSL